MDQISREVGLADHPAGIADHHSLSSAPPESAQVRQQSPVPKERMGLLITSQVRYANDLATTVEPIGRTERSSERAQIDHTATLPEEWMDRRQSGIFVGRRIQIGE